MLNIDPEVKQGLGEEGVNSLCQGEGEAEGPSNQETGPGVRI